MTHVAGKQGQKHKTSANQNLIMASELVRLKTGEPHDEHLAELLQAISPDAESGPDADISGDSIKKKRDLLAKEAGRLGYATPNLPIRTFLSLARAST